MLHGVGTVAGRSVGMEAVLDLRTFSCPGRNLDQPPFGPRTFFSCLDVAILGQGSCLRAEYGFSSHQAWRTFLTDARWHLAVSCTEVPRLGSSKDPADRP